MSPVGKLVIDNEEYVVIPRREFEKLAGESRGRKRERERPAREAAMEIIGRTLLQRRIKAGLSQEELARKAGVRSETISRIESGHFRPRRETMARLDAAMGLK